MSTESQTPDRDPNAWRPCDGQLTNLRGQLRRAESARTRRRAIGGVFAGAVAVLALAFFPGFTPGGISCRECGQLLAAYNDHLTGVAKMADSDRRAVSEHLEACPLCRNHFESEYPGVKPVNQVATAKVSPEQRPRPRG